MLRLVLVTDTFPPLRNSGAIQLRDLSLEFVRQGYELTILLPTASLPQSWLLQDIDGIRILRLKSLKTKEISYVRRTMAEFIMPFAMLLNLRISPLANERFDGVLWYSPSIFHGPLISRLKKSNRCKSYLIIRDIFPEWAVDMGLMRRGGLPYLFFDAVARYQYSVADVIGVQTPGNLKYFSGWLRKPLRKLEVLNNWLGKPADVTCSIRIHETTLVGRKIFVYAGNMGIAQGMNILLDLAEKLQNRKDVGFLFVGRGSEVARLKDRVEANRLDNILIFDEIDPDEIPDLYSQCVAGIVALDPQHKSHNIPGKFLTYIQNGLPVLANINAGNDLANIIREEDVGQVCGVNQVNELLLLTEKLLNQIEEDIDLRTRCIALFEREFSAKNTVNQIVSALSARKVSKL